VKGELCMSGMYDMTPVRLSRRSSHVKFTDEMEQNHELSRPSRSLDDHRETYGSHETRNSSAGTEILLTPYGRRKTRRTCRPP
jgi:hypothetical protein